MKQEPSIIKPVLLATAFADAGPLDETLRLKILNAALRCRQKTGTTPGLYIPVDRCDDVWVCYPAETIQTYQADQTDPKGRTDQTKQAERYPSLIRWPKACALAESHGAAFVACWLPEPEVRYVALDKEHIDDLISKGHTKARHFPGWLCEGAPMSRVWLASDGAFSEVAAPAFIRPSQRGSPLALFPFSRPEPQGSGSAVSVGAADQLQSRTRPEADDAMTTPSFIVNTIPEGFAQEAEIWLRHVYVDRFVVLYLREVFGLPLLSNDWDVIQMRRAQGASGPVAGSGPLQSSPFNLQRRVPGVEVLYEVARMQYAPLVAGGETQQPPRNDVVQAFVSRDKKLFNKSGRAIQAARLTRPDSPRNQGMRDDVKRDFTPEADDILKSEYSLRGPFVSDALALIVHAAKQWLDWKMNLSDQGSHVVALKNELEVYGFKGDGELEAIVEFIIWKDGDYTYPPKSD